MNLTDDPFPLPTHFKTSGRTSANLVGPIGHSNSLQLPRSSTSGVLSLVAGGLSHHVLVLLCAH